MTTKKVRSYSKAFTLVELLIVITIITLLAGIVLIASNPAREKSRITKAAADLQSLTPALERCSNTLGQYPNDYNVGLDSQNQFAGQGVTFTDMANLACDNTGTKKLSDFVTSWPKVPIEYNYAYYYVPRSQEYSGMFAASYCLYAESNKDTNPSPPLPGFPQIVAAVGDCNGFF